VGPGAVSFKRAGAYVAFAAQPFSGTNQDLLNEQLTALKQDFDTYRELPASQITISRDLPALSVLLTGSSNSSQLDCELVTATSAGTGVVMEAIAPTGQLSKVQNDLNQMLKTLQVPR